jgi:hypothetical protein
MKHHLRLTLVSALALTGVGLIVPRAADAHIKLMYPPSRWLESAQGDPQKSGPCGGEALGGKAATPTMMRTKLKPGSTISVTFMETVHHPGHFRVAFDDDGENAFTEPKTPTDIVDPPVMPVLKDNLFPNHQQGQLLKVDITLPNITCSNCTLQVIQVMTEGSAVSMYHHCADIQLTNEVGGGGTDAGVGPTPADGGALPTSDASATGGTAGGGTGGAGGPAGTGGTTGSTGGAYGGSTGGSTGSSATGGSSGSAANPMGVDAGPGVPTSSRRGSAGGCSMTSGGLPAAPFGAFVLLSMLLLTRRRRPERS